MDHRQSSLDAYFSSQTPLPHEDLSAIGDLLAAARSNSLSRLKLTHKPRSLSFVTQSSDASVPRITARHRLVEVKKKHKEVRERLSFVEEQIEALRKDPGAITPMKSRCRRKQKTNRDRSTSSNWDTGTTDQASSEGLRSESVLSRMSFLRKLQREKEQRLHKLQTLETQREQRLAAEAAALLQRTEEEKLRQKQAVLESLQKRHDSELQRKEERKRMKDESEQRLKEVQSKRLLHESLEEKFNEEFVLPELRRQQEAVARKKDAVDISAILKHASDVREKGEQMERKRQEMRVQKKRELKQLAKELNFYRPKAADIVESELSQQKEALLLKSECTKQYQIKKQRYDMLVRELFKPKVSKLKKLEAEFRRNKSVAKVIVSSHSERPLLMRIRQREERPDPPKTQAVKTRRSKSTRSISEKQPIVEMKKKDYLQALRNRRQISAVSRLEKHYESKWQELLNDSSNPARLSEVQREVHRMESWARDQELMLSDMDWQQSVETRDAVSTLYVDSIKAKLALLEELV